MRTPPRHGPGQKTGRDLHCAPNCHSGNETNPGSSHAWAHAGNYLNSCSSLDRRDIRVLATYAFIVALAVTRTGIWQADDVAWLRGSLMDAAKWISGLTGLAASSGLIGLYAHDVADILKTAMETTFTAFTFIVVVYLLYQYSSRPEKQSKRRRRAK